MRCIILFCFSAQREPPERRTPKGGVLDGRTNSRARPIIAPRIAARTSQFTLRGPRRHRVPQWGPWAPPQGRDRSIPPCSPPTRLSGDPHAAKICTCRRSFKNTALRNPEGPRSSCAAGRHAQHFGPFVTQRKPQVSHGDAPRATIDTQGVHRPPATAMDTHSRSSPG